MPTLELFATFIVQVFTYIIWLKYDLYTGFIFSFIVHLQLELAIIPRKRVHHFESEAVNIIKTILHHAVFLFRNQLKAVPSNYSQYPIIKQFTYHISGTQVTKEEMHKHFLVKESYF